MLSKLTETPIGVPENDRKTGALKFPIEFTEMYVCPESPCITLRVLGDALKVNVSRSCALTEK